MREGRGELGDGIGEHRDQAVRVRVVLGIRHRAVLRLQRLQGAGGVLEAEPRRMGLDVGGEVTNILEDLGLSDDGLR